MFLNSNILQTWSGFYKLNYLQRLEKLIELKILTPSQALYLKNNNKHDLDLAEAFIENVIGFFELPLGICTPIIINNKQYIVPLAVEETSIIAALCKTANWINTAGNIATEMIGNQLIGQIQLAHVPNIDDFANKLSMHTTELIKLVNENVASSMVSRGGGVTNMTLKSITRPDGGTMAIVHLHMDCCDSMGANLINQVLEYLKPHIEKLANTKVSMCILSNLNDQKITVAKIVINNIDPALGQKIYEASLFAELDPYRAATHNKGIFNGMDGVLIATGNDWRAVEAGAHAYACRTGQYKPLSTWRYENGNLIGKIAAPIVVGTVGGVTKNHPTAKLCLELMQVQSANELSQVIATVGLIQNLGALRALCTEGIIQGHMQLHIKNILLQIGATQDEIKKLHPVLAMHLKRNRQINASFAEQLLQQLRQHDEVCF